MSKLVKLCFVCKHFHFDLGYMGLHEADVGVGEIECEKGVWKLSWLDHEVDDFRRAMTKARLCSFFEPIPAAEELFWDDS